MSEVCVCVSGTRRPPSPPPPLLPSPYRADPRTLGARAHGGTDADGDAAQDPQ